MVLQKIGNAIIMGKCYLTKLNVALMTGSLLKTKTDTSKTDTSKTGDSINIESLFSGDGAAGDGGALSKLSEQVENYGQGGYSLIFKGVIYVAAIGLLLLFGGMILHGKNPNKKAETKEAFPFVGIGIVGIFSVMALLGLAQYVGLNLF